MVLQALIIRVTHLFLRLVGYLSLTWWVIPYQPLGKYLLPDLV